MARFARVVATGLPQHVTQRGNARRSVFESDADRLVYLQLLDSHCEFHRVSIIGFCLMSNHVHLVLVPQQPDALALALRHAHGRYAAYLNARHGASGHVWQGRYYSCPLDTAHLWAALRYTECNPVRAGMVTAPDRYRWSSAALHCGRADGQIQLHLDVELWRASWSTVTWREFLAREDAEADLEPLRASTHTGRPLGAPDFVRELEHKLHRTLAPRKGGRPRKQVEDPAQMVLAIS
jgi:putative transposase